jgi:hypothetical protein
MGQVEAEIRKPPKGYHNPLGGFTAASSDNPTFSFYSSEGKRFGFGLTGRWQEITNVF